MTDAGGYAPEVDGKAPMAPHPMGDPAHTNKRKRDLRDQGPATARPAPTAPTAPTGPAELSDQAAASYLAAHNASTAGPNDLPAQFDMHQNGGANVSSAPDTAAAALAHYTMTVPQATELAFQPTTPVEGTGYMGGPNESPTTPSGQKPPVGSDEWHKVRRDNHKEVERRRRETINEGINELQKIVPGCEKNKGSILQRAVTFIQQLKENEQQNIEKWTLEKLLTEQALAELTNTVESFNRQITRCREDRDIWKHACQQAGIVPEEFKEEAANANENNQA